MGFQKYEEIVRRWLSGAACFPDGSGPFTCRETIYDQGTIELQVRKVVENKSAVLNSANSGLGLTPVLHRQVLDNPEVSGPNPLPATNQTPTRCLVLVQPPLRGHGPLPAAERDAEPGGLWFLYNDAQQKRIIPLRVYAANP